MSIRKYTVLLLKYIEELETQVEQKESEYNEVCETLERVNQESVDTLRHQLKVAQYNTDTYKVQHAKAMAELQDRSAMLMFEYNLSRINWRDGELVGKKGQLMTIVPLAEVVK